MSRHLFGLPAGHFDKAKLISENTLLFLFHYNTRQLYGIFVRDGPAALNIEPQAWAHYRKAGDPTDRSPFPAQVRWKELRKCRPIKEDLWRHVPTQKVAYKPGGKPAQYDMWMSGAQAQKLAELCIRHGS